MANENSVNSADHLNFINTLWLSKILSLHYDSNCIVSSYNIESACFREGFLSEIGYVSVQFNVNGSDKEENLVVKILPKSEEARQFIQNGKLAEREVNFYKFAQSEIFKNVVTKSDLFLVIPDIIYSTFQDSNLTIVMKNMKHQNFKTLMSRDGSNLEHTLRVFSSIAVVHASGLSYFKRYGNYGVGKFEDTSFYDQYLSCNILRLAEMFNEEPFGNILLKLAPLSKIIRDSPKKYPCFETVIHGDLWAGQCMFSEVGKEVCILDWQFSTIGNPIVDLMGMFFMSSEPIILENNLDMLLEHYWKELSSNLKRNAVTLSVSFIDFVACVEKHWMTGFLFIAVSLHDFLGENNISPKRLKGLMAFLYNRGIFSSFVEENQFLNIE